MKREAPESRLMSQGISTPFDGREPPQESWQDMVNSAQGNFTAGLNGQTAHGPLDSNWSIHNPPTSRINQNHGSNDFPMGSNGFPMESDGLAGASNNIPMATGNGFSTSSNVGSPTEWDNRYAMGFNNGFSLGFNCGLSMASNSGLPTPSNALATGVNINGVGSNNEVPMGPDSLATGTNTDNMGSDNSTGIDDNAGGLYDSDIQIEGIDIDKELIDIEAQNSSDNNNPTDISKENKTLSENDTSNGIEDREGNTSNDVDEGSEESAEDATSGRIQSDADQSHQPPSSAQPVDEGRRARYITNLRTKWLQERGSATQDISIPDGYQYVQVPRVNPGRVARDLYLYGHPNHYAFRSVWEFYPHLKYLIAVTNGEDAGCSCKGCKHEHTRKH